jgi:hypothetical protein
MAVWRAVGRMDEDWINTTVGSVNTEGRIWKLEEVDVTTWLMEWMTEGMGGDGNGGWECGGKGR